ncbi:acyltransferase [Thalassotalea insulae]|uniref:Acyltransferase n=1 Tax=Thalassotalea insulae TaxID=2056778 RepID=A0ABQ6GRY5_9GAMM|nr:1-acyl-sn-glycerol-3-phosphate acyltransferase [Thalassotalea insulae]GLX77387.1 acyltransferase [Thalassotalea insulae]
MILPKVPEQVAKNHFVVSCWFAKKILAWLNWRVTGQFPKQKKFILIVAPHTSNWDFIIAILVMLALNIRVTFLGKDSIFVGPFKWLLEKLGGVGIDRSHPHGIVGQMVNLFAAREKMILGLAPEGTRSKTSEWKKGFLHIAKQADVAVVPVSLDFNKKEVTIMSAQYVSDDIDGSLVQIKAMYQGVCAKNPHLV